MSIDRRALPALVAGFVVSVSSAATLAQEYGFTVDQATSGSTGTIGLNIASSGTLIGTYDPDTNPTGTRTKPATFFLDFPGPMENLPVDASLGLGLNLDATSQTSGDFGLTLDDGLATIDGLSFDLLAGGALSAPVTASVSFESFSTANPNFFYPSVPLNLPLGEVSVDALTATQTGGPVTGIATPIDASNFSVTLAVPVVIQGNASFMGQAFPLEQVPFLLPVTGTLTQDAAGASFSGMADFEFDESLMTDFDLPAFELPLPTIFGDPADVLLNLSLDGLGVAFDTSIALNASGVIIPSPSGAAVLALGGLAAVRRRRG